MTNADLKSMEEKQEAYDRAKARIFSQEVCSHMHIRCVVCARGMHMLMHPLYFTTL